jgi:hypothetical protein
VNSDIFTFTFTFHFQYNLTILMTIPSTALDLLDLRCEQGHRDSENSVDLATTGSLRSFCDVMCSVLWLLPFMAIYNGSNGQHLIFSLEIISFVANFLYIWLVSFTWKLHISQVKSIQCYMCQWHSSWYWFDSVLAHCNTKAYSHHCFGHYILMFRFAMQHIKYYFYYKM